MLDDLVVVVLFGVVVEEDLFVTVVLEVVVLFGDVVEEGVFVTDVFELDVVLLWVVSVLLSDEFVSESLYFASESHASK